MRVKGISALAVIERLQASRQYFEGTKYQKVLDEAEDRIGRGMPNRANTILKQLPTDAQLIEQLMEKLKGKSVCKTLESIQKGKAIEGYTAMKGLSSLLTHVIIECEQGNTEFRRLIPVLMEKINSAGFQILSERKQ